MEMGTAGRMVMWWGRGGMWRSHEEAGAGDVSRLTSAGVVVSAQSLFGYSNTPGQLVDRSSLVPAEVIRELAKQQGTLFYHSHFAMQDMMGMIGRFMGSPLSPYTPLVDRDFGLIIQEYRERRCMRLFGACKNVVVVADVLGQHERFAAAAKAMLERAVVLVA